MEYLKGNLHPDSFGHAPGTLLTERQKDLSETKGGFYEL